MILMIPIVVREPGSKLGSWEDKFILHLKSLYFTN